MDYTSLFCKNYIVINCLIQTFHTYIIVYQKTITMDGWMDG